MNKSIYETQNCRNCGMPYHGVQAFTPNGGFWQHNDERGCIRATAIEVGFLRERIRSLEARNQPMASETIEV